MAVFRKRYSVKVMIAGLFVILCLSWGMTKAYHQYSVSSNKQQKIAPFAYKNIIPKNYQKLGPFSNDERKILFGIINRTIEEGLNGKKISYPDLKYFPKKWQEKRAVFVTINIGDKLRGCKGTQKPKKPFIHALIDATYRAAFKDDRYSRLTKEEFKNPEFNVYFTILGPFQKMKFKNEKDLIKQMTPLKFQYGMRIKYENKSSIMLPSAWKVHSYNRQYLKALKKNLKTTKKIDIQNLIVEYFPAETIYNSMYNTKSDQLIIKKAYKSFKKLFNKDGSVEYLIDFKRGLTSHDVNNMVREMLSGYGLAYIYSETHDKELKPILENFLKYAESVSTPYKNGFLITAKDGEIKSGATALALLTELYYQKETHDRQFSKSREKWKNALLALFKDGEGFYWAPNLLKTNQYYDGEIWLALSVYHDLFPDDLVVADLLPKVNKTMYDKYVNTFKIGFFHWGLQAAAFQYTKNKNPLMYDYMEKQLNFYIDHVIILANGTSCGWAEGLIQAAKSLHENQSLYLKTTERIENELVVARLLQKALENKKNIAPNMKDYLGLFLYLPKESVTRNDLSLHCLSALYNAQSLFQDPK